MTDKQQEIPEACGILPQPYICYTDGACDNNHEPHAGGAAYLIYSPDGKEWKRNSRGALHTTNNRQEMMAIISAVASLPEGSAAIIRTDSQYCIGAFTNGGNANHDLILMFRRYAERLSSVKFEKTKGHSGEPGNETVDRMANEAYRQTCAANGIQVNRFVINGYPKKRRP